MILRNVIGAVGVAFSFLTALPVPNVEWTPLRLRYVPLVMPVVGAAVGALGAGLFIVLRFWDVSYMLRAVVMTLFYLAVTGGLHMDGLMDTCDAVFSRKERRERLEILSDTHVGAFAVMGCASVLMLKAVVFSEMFSPLPFTTSHLKSAGFAYPVLLALIPVYSRLGLGLLFFLPFAKEDGLAQTLGASREPGDRIFLWIACAFFGFAGWPIGLKYLSVPLTGLVSLVFYGRYCVKIFGGVTGDLMGAYVEMSETLMLLALTIVK